MKIGNGEWIIGDCFDAMAKIPDGSVDMILCDLPYGTTQNKWDSVLPLDRLWAEYWRIAKPSAAVVLTAAQPFTTSLISSNISCFKYVWVWVKDRKTNSLNAKIMPMSGHEDVLVFCRGKTVYNPQMRKRDKPIDKKTGSFTGKGYGSVNSGNYERRTDTICPDTVLYFPVERGFHPTQKPVALFEYLIRTYTDEGMTVLDNTAGSGTTAIAAERSGRRWICIERDEEYSAKAIARIEGETRSRLI